MRIKEIIWQDRRDFTAMYECEHCLKTFKAAGYDDADFHMKVIPKLACDSCGKTSPENYRPLATKYSEHQTV